MMKIIRITTVPISLKVLLKGQLKYISNHYDIIAISSPSPVLEEVAYNEGVKTIGVDLTRKITPLKDILSIIKLFLILKREKPLIVHTHTPKAGLTGMIAAYMAGVPHRLHTVAGMPLLEARGIKRKILIAVDWLTYRCTTKIYPNSFVLSHIITKELKLCSKNKVKVIGNGSSNGINIDYFSPKRIENCYSLKKQFNIKEQNFIFCFVGRVVKDKGINELITAFKQFIDVYCNSKLLLIGPFEDSLDPISNESKHFLKTNENVIHTGFVEDVRPYLAISDVFVFPSYREGFPNVVMQAGAMGLPSIVTNINGCNEIIEDGINGIIVPPKDSESLYNAMVELYLNKDKREKMAHIAREMISSRYDQQLVWDAILKEYKSLENDV